MEGRDKQEEGAVKGFKDGVPEDFDAFIKGEAAWEKKLTLTQEQRREVAIAVFSAKGFATRIGLDIIHRMFELMGSSPTGTKYSFDRYMQDLRLFGGLSMPWKGAPQHWKLTYFPPELSSILKSSSI